MIRGHISGQILGTVHGIVRGNVRASIISGDIQKLADNEGQDIEEYVNEEDK